MNLHRTYHLIIGLLFLFAPLCLFAQRPAYFIDGYHGGIYGHIPEWQAKFMVEKLDQYPDWKINLELEPESWDTIEVKYPADYAAFKTLIADQGPQGRIEYINPAYGQSYLYNISGESIIRQFYYGMRKLRQHFPGLVFSSYSSEEPCFTSALPQILRSYGFRYASLKNPNTCWGGYTRAYGGELVNWVGPDGSRLLTVPRYAIEALKSHSTWETIAANNSVAYVSRAFQAGIADPVGMCLQDAGWANGPWIGAGDAMSGAGAADAMRNVDFTHAYHPTVYETWRGYIGYHTPGRTDDDWHFTQEDVLTSLVWGGQILQQVAREVRVSENKLVAAEKLASMAAVLRSGGPRSGRSRSGRPRPVSWPGASFDEAWRTLLLSQHHDCWIVPYNNLRGSNSTWADWVVRWTGNSNRRADSIADQSMKALVSRTAHGGLKGPALPASLTSRGDVNITVFNTTAVDRDECVSVALPAGWAAATVLGADGKAVMSQRMGRDSVLFRAQVPQVGWAVYRLRQAPATAHLAQGAHTIQDSDGAWRIETDLYSMRIDPAKGGVITNLATKGNHSKVFVDGKGIHQFNELRGNFYKEGGFHSSTETPARVAVIENGPLRVRIRIDGEIAGTGFAQILTLRQGERRIDVHLGIGWSADHKIGELPDSIRGEPLRKEFYNDSFKLQALFPTTLRGQQVYKNAPFDVLKSRLDNTFFNSWDSIKNAVVLNWVDVADAANDHGLAVFSDETTSYAHGPDYPLALTVQYSGPGLFGRDYSITGPTVMDYAILPHAGRWDRAGVCAAASRWNEPLLVKVGETLVGEPLLNGRSAGTVDGAVSMFRLANTGWEVSAMTVSGNDLLMRLFNAEAKDSVQRVYAAFECKSASLVGLDGQVLQQLAVVKDNYGKTYITITAQRFGIRTIKFNNVLQ